MMRSCSEAGKLGDIIREHGATPNTNICGVCYSACKLDTVI